MHEKRVGAFKVCQVKMGRLSFVTLDVFTQKRFAGNPLAVVIISKDQEVTKDQRQGIAREFNLSETVFLAREEDSNGLPEWRVYIHMTDRELPFAGHPTIGSACYALGTLANNASKGRLVCNAGPVDVDYEDGVAEASIPHNVRVHTETKFPLHQLWELQPALQKAAEPMSIDVVSPVKGMNFICVELADLDCLALVQTSGLQPKTKLDEGWHGFQALYFYVLLHGFPQNDTKVAIRTRMIEGSLEDPATGSAACGLSAYLALKHKRQRVQFEITQGLEMGRQSDIGVTVTLKESLRAVEKIKLSGTAVKVMEGTLQF